MLSLTPQATVNIQHMLLIRRKRMSQRRPTPTAIAAHHKSQDMDTHLIRQYGHPKPQKCISHPIMSRMMPGKAHGANN